MTARGNAFAEAVTISTDARAVTTETMADWEGLVPLLDCLDTGSSIRWTEQYWLWTPMRTSQAI